MISPLLTAIALSATSPTVTVRVLELEKPSKLEVEGAAMRCDEAVLPKKTTLEVGYREVRAGANTCNVVSIEGPVTITAGATKRHLPGTVRVVIEAGLLKVLNEVELERYLVSVVGLESKDVPKAVLEAQAIVSRTFAVTAKRRHSGSGFDVCDHSHCQLYRGQEGESPEAQAAVEKTAGQVLLVGGITLKPAFSHAACGGHTDTGADVFGEDAASPGVSDGEGGAPLCRELPNFSWSWEVDRPTFTSRMGIGTEGNAFEALRRDKAGRVLELRSFGKRFSGEEFMARVTRAFGPESLRSLKVSFQEAESTLRFTGTGAGHGVGLCQQGARALAAKGADARAILKRYFPDSQVRVP